MPHAGRSNEEAQASALFGGQLQAAKGPLVEPAAERLGPGEHRRDGRASQRLVQGPIVIGPLVGMNQQQSPRRDSQPHGGRRIKLPLALDHDQRPSLATRLAGDQYRQQRRPRPLVVGEPLDERAAAKSPLGKQVVHRRTAARDRRVVGVTFGAFDPGDLLAQHFDGNGRIFWRLVHISSLF